MRERIEALPGMPALLAALDGLPPVYLVGGAVRDLLRGADVVDIDVAVEGNAVDAARTIAERLGGEPVAHGRFGTATVRSPELTLDLATTRRERYERPGVLPEVEFAPLGEDLGRRDFSVNAMALGLSGDSLGELHDPHGGVEDLKRGVIRVLYEKSFLDDPTRILRALRYEARLGARMDHDTEILARATAAAGALSTVSGARVRDELLDLLAEPNAPDALERMRELRVDRALHPALAADCSYVASAALAAGETGADRVLASLAALVSDAPDELTQWVEELGLTREPRDRVVRAARRAPELARELTDDTPPSALHDLMEGEPPETLALALGMGAPARPVLRFLSDVRGVRLEVTGDDLLAAGVPRSPAVGRALAETLRRKLDGEVSGRDDELAVALALARGEKA